MTIFVAVDPSIVSTGIAAMEVLDNGKIKVHKNIFRNWSNLPFSEDQNLYKIISSQFPHSKYTIHKYLKSVKDVTQAVFKLEHL